jgi:crossover junction endodeoxyribonuclease RuvC
MSRLILGIDVGIAITGWAILNSEKNIVHLKDYGAIITESKLSIQDRLSKLYDGLDEIIRAYKPTDLAVESLFYFKNKKTIINVGQARGVILLAGAKNNLSVFHYTPLQVKIAVTGYGRASKIQIQNMVKSIFKLSEVPKPDDVADAIAVGYCHISSAKF